MPGCLVSCRTPAPSGAPALHTYSSFLFLAGLCSPDHAEKLTTCSKDTQPREDLVCVDFFRTLFLGYPVAGCPHLPLLRSLWPTTLSCGSYELTTTPAICPSEMTGNPRILNTWAGSRVRRLGRQYIAPFPCLPHMWACLTHHCHFGSPHSGHPPDGPMWPKSDLAPRTLARCPCQQ